MAVPKDEILIVAVDTYVAANPQGPRVDRQKLKEEIVNQTRIIIDAQNALLTKTTRMKVPDKLANVQIARIIELLEAVALISCNENGNVKTESDLIGVYEHTGPDEGIYNTSDRALMQLITCYNFMATEYDLRETRHALKLRLKAKPRCMDPDLIAVNNGIFNYKTKQLEPFTPDKIFLSKSAVNYNPNARNVIIHNPDDNTDWDVVSWLAGLNDDPETVNLLWEILGAIIRPSVRWNKSAWLYSESGNSGKGTFCELMRNLCGRGNYTSIALADFSKEFYLEALLHSNAIIVDENDVGVYLDRVANLKAVITNDVILINRKHKKPIPYQFFGFMVQCLNEYPKVRDRSNSFYRRQLFIPFDKCYTGVERPYIKNEYLSRQDVLEYVLFKVLNMNYYKLSEPATCKMLLEDLKTANSPVREFVEEILPQCRWDLLPFSFLYDLYKAWFAKVNPGGSVLGRNVFIRELLAAISDNPDWMCEDKQKQVPSNGRMESAEYLILRYNLKDWMNPTYTGTVPEQICHPALSASYRGLLRKVPSIAAVSTYAIGYTKSVNTPVTDMEKR